MAEEHQIAHKITGLVGNGQTKINELPDEMLVKIFSYLSIEDLGLNAQFVCTRWSHLSLDSVLWKDLIFRIMENMSVDYLSTLLHKMPNLQCVEVYQYTPEIFNKLAECCKNLRKLKEIRFSFNFNTGEETVKAVQNLVMECTKLEELQIPSAALCSEELAAFVGQLSRLRAITIDCTSEEAPKLKHIADGCPSLQHLDMNYTKWSYSDLEYFLEQKNKLLCLRISYISIEDCFVFPLLALCQNTLRELKLNDDDYYFGYYIDGPTFSNIKTLTSLSSLKIEIEKLETDVLANLFEDGAMSQLVDLQIDPTYVIHIVCDNCPHLLRLWLSCPLFGTVGIPGRWHLFPADDDQLKNLYKCANLEELILDDRDKLTDVAVGHIARCTKLKSLNLSHCTLTEEAVRHLQDLSQLRHLTLDSSNVAGLHLDLFALHLQKLKTLKFVECYGIDTVALNVLRAEMPHLRVFL